MVYLKNELLWILEIFSKCLNYHFLFSITLRLEPGGLCSTVVWCLAEGKNFYQNNNSSFGRVKLFLPVYEVKTG